MLKFNSTANGKPYLAGKKTRIDLMEVTLQENDTIVQDIGTALEEKISEF